MMASDPLGNCSPPQYSGGTSTGAGNKLYSLHWNSFQTHFPQKFMQLLLDEEFTDVILASEGKFLKAHKIILSMCSPYFKLLLKANTSPGIITASTIIILNNVKFTDLEKIIQFIYCGEVKVAESELKTFLSAGDLLQIEGLFKPSENGSSTSETEIQQETSTRSESSYKTVTPTKGGSQSNPGSSRSSSTGHPSSSGFSTFSSHLQAISKLSRTFPSHKTEGEGLACQPHELEGCEMLEVEGSAYDISGDVDEFNNSEDLEETQTGNGHQLDLNNLSEVVYVDDLDEEEEEEDQEMTIDEPSNVDLNPNRNSPPKRLAALRNNLVNRSHLKRGHDKEDMTKFRPCPYCQQMFYKSNLSRHVSQAHTQELVRQGKQLFKCDVCRYIYRTDQALKIHQKKQHPQGF